MGTYDSIIRTQAKAAIDRFVDSPQTVTRMGTYDPGTDTEGPSTTYSIKGFIGSFEAKDLQGDGLQGVNGGTTVLASDIKFVVAHNSLPSGFEWAPETDFVTIGDRQCRIVNIKEVYGGDQVAMYILQLRR